jgi:hypothetical protein
MKSINHILAPSSPLFTLLPPTSTPHTVPILQSCLWLLMMFKGVSQWIPAVSLLYCGQFNPCLTLYLPPPLFTSFQCTSLCPLPAQMWCFMILWCSIILFSFPSFPEFHRVVPLLKTCSTSEFVYDHVWFCVCVYFLDLSSTCERKHAAFVFLNLANFS